MITVKASKVHNRCKMTEYAAPTMEAQIESITDLEVYVQAQRSLTTIGDPIPAYKVVILPDTHTGCRVVHKHQGGHLGQPLQQEYFVQASVQQTAETARKRGQALLAAADICDLLNEGIGD